MSHCFQFEADFVESLRCIPMIVRMKLDLCGIKLKLSHWHRLNQDDRQTLVELPCTAASEIQSLRSDGDLFPIRSGRSVAFVAQL